MQALSPKPKPFYAKLHNQVIIAILAAIIVGAVWPDTAVKMKPLGDGSIKLIGMMIAPIVFCIIVSGIAGMGSARRVGRIGVKSLVYFYVVSALALLLVASVARAPAGSFAPAITLASMGKIDSSLAASSAQ